ncbi:MAG: hypothetical protein ACK47B_00995 [Armatimonadota bacterium]
MRLRALLPSALLLLTCFSLGAAAQPVRPFAIEVVDEETGRGVPLVELKTVHAVRYVTDSHGLAAITEPGYDGRLTFFSVTSHGYELPPDGFGIRGVRLKVEPGKTATVKIRRKNLAHRLYRVTGEGIYRDSVLVGRETPIREPLLNAQVVGQDSVQNAIYQGRMFWMWGDTSQLSYPLGNFHMTGATTALPKDGGLDPDRGVNLEYFQNESGFTREMAPLPGEGLTWLGALVVLPEGGRERLFAGYSKIKPPLEEYERGLCRYDDEKGQFVGLGKFPMDAPIIPFGHPVKRTVDGVEYVYFGDPFPLVRVRANAAALRDLSQYEAFTPLRQDSRLEKPEIDRDAAGKVRYAWKRNTPAVGSEAEAKLIQEGHLKREERRFVLQDPDSGKPVVIHRGTVHWNPYRNRWIMIATEIGGTSMLGEVWYAEADDAQGPWLHPRKIVTHERYSFYNPVHHPEFDKDDGRRIYFEGTYTHAFSGNPDQTPRYDYNQVMYRLDLGDSRLKLPQPGKP